MGKKGRERRKPCVVLSPQAMEHFANEDNLWHETPEEIVAGLEWGRGKGPLLRYLRRLMQRKLTRHQRRCVELYFFRGLNYRQAAARTGTHPSSVHRAVQRSLRRLRQAIEEEAHVAPKNKPRG